MSSEWSATKEVYSDTFMKTGLPSAIYVPFVMSMLNMSHMVGYHEFIHKEIVHQATSSMRQRDHLIFFLNQELRIDKRTQHVVDTFISNTDETAIYHMGAFKDIPEAYTFMGMVGEYGEFMSALDAYEKSALEYRNATFKNMLKEAGDVFWYIARAAKHAGIEFTHIFASPDEVRYHQENLDNPMLMFSRLAELYKKLYRDHNGEYSDTTIECVRDILRIIQLSVRLNILHAYNRVCITVTKLPSYQGDIHLIKNMCGNVRATDILRTILVYNTEKLRKRLTDNTLQGNGDNR